MQRIYRKKFNLGIVLGGGGARGFAHLGVLKALEEKGFVPDIISGNSAGSIAGVFIASGKKPDEVHNLIKNHRLLDIAKIHWPRLGLMSLEGLQEDLQKQIKASDLKELPIPFYAAVSNLNEGKVEYLNEGPLDKIILASASIPVLFSPVEMNKMLYADGGIFDNVPVKPLIGKCKKIIAVSISPVQREEKLEGLLQLAGRAFQLSVNRNIHEIKEQVDLFIEPEALSKYDILDSEHSDELFEIGYEYCKNLTINL
ncbi:MAG: patatin-like phospholipase family protein [Lewinellaceae bacterium]|nr:patatin-like phospholipase family protein [Lewinellaceae bacterium]